jgi:hypothetical protein
MGRRRSSVAAGKGLNTSARAPAAPPADAGDAGHSVFSAWDSGVAQTTSFFTGVQDTFLT